MQLLSETSTLPPSVAPDNLATCTQIEANVALAEWQQEQRAFEAQLAAVAAAMTEPQPVPA